ncbi:hypothetical protein B0H14DRAFT_1058686 [Mycena olivaceomarginata]|nr:hypothetical protein B0H14DRAFT_1058686 [Mycena olivaceomarginata]
MFDVDATMRAVSERRSEKLDDVSADNVKLDAWCSKAEMERVRAEGERDVMKEAVKVMAQVLVNLVGMLGRCTVLVGDAASVLSGPGGPDDASKVAGLNTVKEKNDEGSSDILRRRTRMTGASRFWRTSRATRQPSLAGSARALLLCNMPPLQRRQRLPEFIFIRIEAVDGQHVYFR